MPIFIMAQNLVLPKETRDHLKGIKGNEIITDTNTTSSNYNKKKITDNLWDLRVEYVLQYDNHGVITSLAKSDNDYFGYVVSFGIAADNLIWLNRKQLNPWEIDPEYELYKDDTLTPVLSNILAKKVGESEYKSVIQATDRITLIDSSLIAYKLPSENTTLKVKNNSPLANPWLLLISKNQTNNIPDLVFVSIINTEDSTISDVLLAHKNMGRTYTQGAILYYTQDTHNYYLSDIIFINYDKFQITKVQYKEALKVVKTSDSDTNCCCEDIEKASSKSERKAIIKKWKSLLKKANKDIENEEDNNKRKALIKVKNQCEAKLNQYK